MITAAQRGSGREVPAVTPMPMPMPMPRYGVSEWPTTVTGRRAKDAQSSGAVVSRVTRRQLIVSMPEPRVPSMAANRR
jgi:hypothetical protein